MATEQLLDERVLVGKEVCGGTLGDQLREWLGLCGCGQPETMLALLREVLRALERGRHEPGEGFPPPTARVNEWSAGRRQAWDLSGGDERPGLAYTYLNWMDGLDLIEHGGGIGGSWLTETGRAFLAELEKWVPEVEP